MGTSTETTPDDGKRTCVRLRTTVPLGSFARLADGTPNGILEGRALRAVACATTTDVVTSGDLGRAIGGVDSVGGVASVALHAPPDNMKKLRHEVARSEWTRRKETGLMPGA